MAVNYGNGRITGCFGCLLGAVLAVAGLVPSLALAEAAYPLPNSYTTKSVTGRPITVYPSTLQAANDGRFLVQVDAVKGTTTRRATVQIAPRLNALLSRIVPLASPARWVGGSLVAAGLVALSVAWQNDDGTVTSQPKNDASVPVIPPATSGSGWVAVGSNRSVQHPAGSGTYITVYGNAPSYYRYASFVRVYIPESYRLSWNNFMLTYPSAPTFPNASSTRVWMEVDGTYKYEQRYTADLSAGNFSPLSGYGASMSVADMVARLPNIFASSEPVPMTAAELASVVSGAMSDLGADLSSALVLDNKIDTGLFDIADPFESPELDTETDSGSDFANPENNDFDPSLFDINLETTEFDFKNALSLGSPWLPRSCPAPFPLLDVDIMGRHFAYSFDYEMLCGFLASYFSPIMLLLGWLNAFFIVYRTVTN